MLRRATQGEEREEQTRGARLLLKEYKCHFNDNNNNNKKTFIRPCYPDQDDTMVHILCKSPKTLEVNVI